MPAKRRITDAIKIETPTSPTRVPVDLRSEFFQNNPVTEIVQAIVLQCSFYWHFRDIADFRSQLLRSWQEISTDQVIQDLDAREGEPDRLKHLTRRAFDGTRNLDRAIRSWAAEDEDVARIVASVDGRRVAGIAKLLAEASVEGERALHRAAFLYWAYLGQAVVMDPRHASISAVGLDDISDLFET